MDCSEYRTIFTYQLKRKQIKTMKAQTLSNRLAKRFNGSKSSKAYQIIKDVVENTNKSYMVYSGLIRPCRTSGSGRFTSNLDYTRDVEVLLNTLGVKFESGNDSPRGGKTGNFIKITTKIEY